MAPKANKTPFKVVAQPRSAQKAQKTPAKKAGANAGPSSPPAASGQQPGKKVGKSGKKKKSKAGDDGKRGNYKIYIYKVLKQACLRMVNWHCACAACCCLLLPLRPFLDSSWRAGCNRWHATVRQCAHLPMLTHLSMLLKQWLAWAQRCRAVASQIRRQTDSRSDSPCAACRCTPNLAYRPGP